MQFTKIFLKYDVCKGYFDIFYLLPGFGRHFVSFVTTPNLFPLINILRVYIIFTTIYHNFKRKVTCIIKNMIFCVHLSNRTLPNP